MVPPCIDVSSHEAVVEDIFHVLIAGCFVVSGNIRVIGSTCAKDNGH